jgi:hypothetical protein
MEHWERIAADMVALVVNDLGLRWIWLGIDLYRAFVTHVIGRLRNITQPIVGMVPRGDVPAPRLTCTFSTHPGEMVHAAQQRLRKEIEAVMAHLESARPPQGRVPANLEREAQQGVGKYARWLYRHRLCGESIRSLAQRYHTEQRHPRPFWQCDCRRGVRYGIKEAERLLGLADVAIFTSLFILAKMPALATALFFTRKPAA